MTILALAQHHDRARFDCGNDELNRWLQRVARQHQDKGLSRTFVIADTSQPEQIRAYCALTLTELENRHLPREWAKKLPRRIPGVRLGRLAVDRACQGQGLGELLLMDALTRAARIHREAGGIGLFVDAIDQQAAGYYRQFGFVALPENPLLLFFPAQGAL